MLCLFLLKLCLFQCSFCFFNLIKCFLSIFLKMFSSSPYRSFSPFSTLPFSLLRDRHFCRKGNPSSDGSSANTFGIPLQKDATSVGRTYLLRYISALFCFQHPSFSYSNGSFFSIWRYSLIHLDRYLLSFLTPTLLLLSCEIIFYITLVA